MKSTWRIFAGVCLLAVVFRLSAVEPWADKRLPVLSGLRIWLDCAQQNAGRASRQLPPLASGNEVDYLMDASGAGRHLSQPIRDARPRFRQEFSGAFLSFDGLNDFLMASVQTGETTNLTVFIVAAPRLNAGDFRGFLSFSQLGRNDYNSGLNLDLGPQASLRFSYLNAEGGGMSGVAQFLRDPARDFGAWYVLDLESQPGTNSVRLSLNGKPQGARDRRSSVVHLDQFTLGARLYSNVDAQPYAQGFFAGGIAELLVYDRILSAEERGSVLRYLEQKYGTLLQRPPEPAGASTMLTTVTNPPPVQVLLPGFSVRELPVPLKNINNVKYRQDGKLVALGYDGTIYLLSDSKGDGVEDKVSLFWTNQTLRAPIGMALTPPGYALGQGVFVASKGKLSLIVDTNGDDRADREIVVASGWQELSHGVDALGVVLDKEGNIYFGLGAASYTNPYLVDKASGVAHYDLGSERGTILKVSPDFQRREIFCTGIRFSVALARNGAGDLFATDQEGATWLPNGNPLDELLHLERGRSYGFPPRHPRYLPNVIDEPSVMDYGPQHQSTCGLNFNESVNGGPVFGPAAWTGDALVAGYSRGKIWRTRLEKTPAGYVAQNQLIAALAALTVDACVSPKGDLVVATHSGEPDWGSGPDGAGHLYKITYTNPATPQPVATWATGPGEFRIAFDRPVPADSLKPLVKRVVITQGKYVSAGDRFEVLRPGYAAVFNQLSEPRYDLPVASIGFTPDRRTLILNTKPHEAAVNYAIALYGAKAMEESGATGLPQHPDIDLQADLHGLEAQWKSAAKAEGDTEWNGWLPHLDLSLSKRFTAGSAEHERLWALLGRTGNLTLRGQLDVWEMLQPAIQPGSQLDYERPIEAVTLLFSAKATFQLRLGEESLSSAAGADGRQQVKVARSAKVAWVPFELSLPTGATMPAIEVTWFTADDPRPRPLALRRFWLPWARADLTPTARDANRSIPELTGGNWLNGRRLFFSPAVNCQLCHWIRGEGHQVGPDLSNLIHRDYGSVLRDIRIPSAALNPDFLAYNVQLKNGEELTGIVQNETRGEITVVNAAALSRVVSREQIQSMKPSPVSLMPEGLVKDLKDAELKDLMTFLLTTPLEPAPAEIPGEPPARKRDSVAAVLKADAPANGSKPPVQTAFSILLCAGPKDHGPGEHDYPLWQKRWEKLLGVVEGVRVSTAWEWPAAEQFKTNDVVVFYSDNPGWSQARAGELDAFLGRGGGLVYLHYAVDGHDEVPALAQRIGLAWRGGTSKFRHGDLHLKMTPGPLTAGMDTLELHDESYWDLVGDPTRVQVIASGEEDGQPRPLLWTRTEGRGRIFVSIPGHFTWTFDDPLFRVLLLRGISWAGGRPADRLTSAALIGARLAD